MSQIFTSFFITSMAGTLLAFFIILIKPITKRCFSYSWHYYMWIVVLLVMIMPIRINLPENIIMQENITEYGKKHVSTEEFSQEYEEYEYTEQADESSIIRYAHIRMNVISVVWFSVAIIMFLIKIINYLLFLIKGSVSLVY